MRYLSIVVFAFVLVPSFSTAEPLTPRPLDPIAADAFARAQEGSAVVRSLVAKLETSNVIVHILSSGRLPMGVGGTTQFVTSRGGFRYVRITIAAGLWRSERTAIIGHELQHAWEIAASGANDADSVEQLFLKEGHRLGDYYETRAAISTERQVRSELTAARSARTLQAEPVVKFDH